MDEEQETPDQAFIRGEQDGTEAALSVGPDSEWYRPPAPSRDCGGVLAGPPRPGVCPRCAYDLAWLEASSK